MIERTMKIELENGLEARPVAVLVQKASMHDSTIYIHAEGKKSMQKYYGNDESGTRHGRRGYSRCRWHR